MSDAAFPTGAYPGYTTAELLHFVERWRNTMQTDILVGDVHLHAAKVEVMQNEIIRRERVAEGDVSAMTPGERLHFNRKKAT